MYQGPLTAKRLAASVLAVPPLARHDDGRLSAEENRKLIQYLEAGGIRSLLYGGNANLYHVAPSQYAHLLAMLVELAGEETLVIPSVGPAYGMMMDQAEVLRDFDFPTAMVLPQREITTPEGIAQGIRHFAERLEKPVVLYLKHDGLLPIPLVQSLVEEHAVALIKYAIVRSDPTDDPYLAELVQRVDPWRIVSGIGEQPAIVHLRKFGLISFTSGCVCIAPRLSTQMLRALQHRDVDRAEKIRQMFCGLEDLRNQINPIRVLHLAVAQAGIANTGPLQPLLGPLDADQQDTVGQAARQLRALEPNP